MKLKGTRSMLRVRSHVLKQSTRPSVVSRIALAVWLPIVKCSVSRPAADCDRISDRLQFLVAAIFGYSFASFSLAVWHGKASDIQTCNLFHNFCLLGLSPLQLHRGAPLCRSPRLHPWQRMDGT